MRAKVVLEKAKQNTVLKGHPWIFPKAIAKTQGKLINGELIDIMSADEEFIAVGAYNQHSLYRVRVLAHVSEGFDCSSFSTIINHRLRQAYQVRQCLNLPNLTTTAYRLFNSEADGLSGLTVDRFNHYCIVASSAYWVELNKNHIIDAIHALLPQDKVIWLPQIKPLGQDGWTNVEQSTLTQHAEVLELGVKFHVEFAHAQKTGLFLDQRENHHRVAELAKGKRVLDLYTYTGGFALHAAKAGALQVTAVDSSAHAIAQAQHNAKLNELEHIEFVEADARTYLDKAGQYDIVILDPPKLVPSQQHVQRAKNYYRYLHRELFKHMRSGSILMTCNCSSALSTQEFTALVSAQAAVVGKQARIVGVYGPSSCHPTLSVFPEGSYLTAVLMVVI